MAPKDPAANYAKVKAWRAANPEKVAEQTRRWRERHPDVARARSQRYIERNLELVRERGREARRAERKNNPEAQQRRYQAYKERQEAQRVAVAGRPRPDVCEICQSHGRTVWDHDHERGHFRGWICDRCNKVLGLIYDDPLLLLKLAVYLEETRGQAHTQSA